MNNWLKIGVPILVAVLLVISAVSVTLAVTNGNKENRAAASYAPVTTVADTGTVNGASCPNCPGYAQATTGDQGTTTNPVYIPQGKLGSCCTGISQGTASSQTFRGGCCGSRQ